MHVCLCGISVGVWVPKVIVGVVKSKTPKKKGVCRCQLPHSIERKLKNP